MAPFRKEWIQWKKVNTFIYCNRGELVQIGLHVLKSNWRYTATFNIGAIDCIGRWGFSFIELSWHDFRCLEHFNLWTERSVWPSLGSVCILYTQQVTVTLVIRWQSPSYESLKDLPKWLSPSLALRQWCQLAVHGMWNKMTGTLKYLSCLQITLIKWLSPLLAMW